MSAHPTVNVVVGAIRAARCAGPQDFTVDDPLKAEPALFTVQGERNKETTFSIGTTVQIDFHPASFTVLKAATGPRDRRRPEVGSVGGRPYDRRGPSLVPHAKQASAGRAPGPGGRA